MSIKPVYIAAAGIVSPLGRGLAATEQALRENRSALAPLTTFPLLQNDPMPVGQVSDLSVSSSLPRTHSLALEAARMALNGFGQPPDAVILGSTTGGILTTEELLRENVTEKERYSHHGLASVALEVAEMCRCPGPALVLSTACSSSAVAIALALRLLKRGEMQRILVGGVDSLCRLTYFGFHSLQLVDRRGSHPLDRNRQGISVAEGAAMLMLTTVRPRNPLAIISGAGLSCDAYHPTAPHPEGQGAFAAMRDALADAEVGPSAVDYINLHGTGTPDNDLAETKAIRALFPTPPPLSSIKGATGHSLAASGAIEAVVASLAVSKGFIPGNTGCQHPDPELGVTPELEPLARPVQVVLSNSLGFGGNNGSLVIARSDTPVPVGGLSVRGPLAVHGCACLTGAGMTDSTLEDLRTGASVAGMAAATEFGGDLPPRLIRRVKRLARMSLSLASCAHANIGEGEKPSAVFMGTGWGALSETFDFLDGLSASSEQFPRPTDFVGSVHNGPAGQIALFFGATGANVTVSGGDYSFEQALFAADSLLEDGQSALLMGADEAHEKLSPLLDPSIVAKNVLADGGGALYVNRDPVNARCLVRLPFYQRAVDSDSVGSLVEALGGVQAMEREYAVILAGVSAGQSEQGRRQLLDLANRVGSQVPILRYRDFIGEFASASAVAAVLAVAYLDAGFVPGVFGESEDIPIQGSRKILVLGTGPFLTAMEFFRP